MLRIIIATTALIAFVNFIAPDFAAARGHGAMASVHAGTYTYVTGTIVSIDVATNKVVIKESSGTDTTVVVDAKDASALKAGDKVKTKIKRCSNTAVSVSRCNNEAPKKESK